MADAEEGARDNSDSSQGPPPVPQVVDGRFEIKHKIGSGSYSDVYLGYDRVAGEQVAGKFEWTKAEKGRRLLAEAQLYESFRNSGDVPQVRWWGTQGEFNIMIMELLGPSLEDLFESRGRRFSLNTVLMLGHQMVDRMQYVHSLGILHRDIKPQNFLIGLGKQSHKVFVMDFGLAKRYLDPATGSHIPNSKKKGLTGTVRYTTLNVHNGHEPSRRDDLGAIGYVLMYFLRGRLPWQGISAKSKRTKQKKIGKRKERVSHEELCQGYPDEFVEFLKHCDGVEYADPPDYDHLRRLLQAAQSRERLACDWRFDWIDATQHHHYLEEPQVAAAVKPGEDQKGSRSSKRRRVSPENGQLPKPEEEEESDEYEYDEYEYDEEEESEEEESEEEESEEEEEESEHTRDAEDEDEKPAAQGMAEADFVNWAQAMQAPQTPGTPSFNPPRRSRWG